MAHLNCQGSSKCLQIVCVQMILIITIIITCHSNAKVICPNKFAATLSNSKNRTYYECPSIYQLQSYTSCCHDKDECCPPPKQGLGLFSLIFIGSIMCAIFIISLVLCTFHPSGLLYNAIKKRHTKDKTSYAHRMGETSSLFDDMPGENTTSGMVIVPQPLDDSNGGGFDTGGGDCAGGDGGCDSGGGNCGGDGGGGGGDCGGE